MMEKQAKSCTAFPIFPQFSLQSRANQELILLDGPDKMSFLYLGHGVPLFGNRYRQKVTIPNGLLTSSLAKGKGVHANQYPSQDEGRIDVWFHPRIE